MWKVSDAGVAYPTYPAQHIALNEPPGSPPATWRPMIAVNEAGTRVSTGGLSTGYLWTGDSGALSKFASGVPGGSNSRASFVSLASSIRPAPGGTCAALAILGLGSSIEELGCRGGHLVRTWSRGQGLEPETTLDSAISPDGHLVALAEPNELELTETLHGKTRTFPAEELVAVDFDRDDELIAVDGDGELLEIDRSGGIRQVPVNLDGETVQAAAAEPSGAAVLLAGADGHLDLVDAANGVVLKRLTFSASLSGLIDVRTSGDGRLAVILARSGYWVVDLERWRVIAAGEGYGDNDLGAEPRDGAFVGSGTGPGDTLLILRADEGIQTLPLERWRFLDGTALLETTAQAVPRAFTSEDAATLDALPSAGE